MSRKISGRGTHGFASARPSAWEEIDLSRQGINDVLTSLNKLLSEFRVGAGDLRPDFVLEGGQLMSAADVSPLGYVVYFPA